MRITHVATLVSPDGAFGGPIRVALNQLRALQDAGHDVELLAGHRGFAGPAPTDMNGVPVALYPIRTLVPGVGFAGVASPALVRSLRRRLAQADVVHIHLARDLVTMPAARAVLRAGTPLVAQPHGMIDASSNRLVPAFDRLFTRAVLRGSARVLALTEIEQRELELIQPGAAAAQIVNGVPEQEMAPEPGAVDVLFLARLHPRKRAPMFVAMARDLLDSGVLARFSIVGPDEGDAPEVRRLIAQSGWADHIVYEGALDPEETLARIRAATIYVLPSIGEIVPMSVLEAMSVGKAVAITTSNGLADDLVRHGAGVVVDESVASLTAAVRELLTNRDHRHSVAAQAHRLVRERYSIAAVARHLESIYLDAAEGASIAAVS